MALVVAPDPRLRSGAGFGTLEVREGPFGRSDAAVIVHEHLFDWPELDALVSWPEVCRAAPGKP